VCTGPILYKGQKQLQTDLDNLRAALKEVKVEEAFVPAISPANVEVGKRNEYYKTQGEFSAALADALREEYKAIVDAGFLLQIDDPHLVTSYIRNPKLTIQECRQEAEKHVELLNYALRGIPEDRIRFHTCYSINIGPRIHDMELKDIVDIILKIRAQSYSFESANPRHDHEWRVWESVKLPVGRLIIPGVITHSNVLVEHPQLVADRLMRFANAVGRENVIAGVDCGFGTMGTIKEIHPTIVWAKFRSLVEGARIASQQLWGRAATI
jgi:5-methyltetrahydropteroyltriglutamate--homocysteine methyltransferase